MRWLLRLPTSEWRIADNADDVEELVATGSIDMGSSDLELAYEDPGQVDPQIIGVRFTEIPIPMGHRNRGSDNLPGRREYGAGYKRSAV